MNQCRSGLGVAAALAAVCAALGCTEDATGGPQPPRAIRPPAEAPRERPAPQRVPAVTDAAVNDAAPAGRAPGAPASPESVLVLAETATARMGLEGTSEGAAAWLVARPKGARADPEVLVGRLEGPAIAGVFEALAAMGWPALAGEGRTWSESRLLVAMRGGIWSRARVSDECRCDEPGPRPDGGCSCPAHSAVRALEAAVRAVARPLGGKTELVVPGVPRQGPASAKPVDASCERAAGVECTIDDEGLGECFPTPQRGVFLCLHKPWQEQGQLVRSVGRVVVPQTFAVPWAVELEDGTRCSGERGLPELECQDGTALLRPVAGPGFWVAHRAIRRDQELLPGQPLVLKQVFPRSARMRPGTAVQAPRGGPFTLELRAANDLSGWSQALAIQGDKGPARAWFSRNPGTWAGKGESKEFREGTLAAPVVAGLWKTLDSLDWPNLQPAAIPGVTDQTLWTVYLRRGEVEVEATMQGGCNCPAPGPAAPPPGCPCSIQPVIDALTAAARQAPEVIWDTRRIAPPRAAGPGRTVEGKCGDLQCEAKGERFARCFPVGPDRFFCPDAPWKRTGVTVKSKRTDDDVLHNPSQTPWGVELRGGLRCAVGAPPRDGRETERASWELDCSDGSRVRSVRSDGDAWLAERVDRAGGESLAPVVTAWMEEDPEGAPDSRKEP